MRPKVTLFLTLVTVVLSGFIGCGFAALTINTGEYTNKTLRSAQYYWKGDEKILTFDTITGQLADSGMTDLNGKIVFQEFVGTSSWIDQITKIKNAGAIAVIYGTRSVEPGQYGCAMTAAQPTGVIPIPIAEINDLEFEEIRQAILSGAVINATLTSEGQMQIGSPWNMLGGIPVIIVFRFIFTAVAVGLIGFALYKLILFVRDQQAQFNVPQVCLALEIIANILRIIYLAVDPFSCFGVYGLATSFLTPLSFPFEVATFTLITFYWFEAVTNASITVYPFIDKFKPFFFAFTIIFPSVIVLISVLGYFLAFSVTLPVAVLYVTTSLAFVIFYVVTVVKIIKKMARSDNMRQKKTQRLSEINVKIILNGITRFVSLIPPILFIVPSFSTTPIGLYVGSVFMFATVYIDSWARIFLFREPDSSKSGKSGKKGSSGTTKTDLIDTATNDAV